MSLSHLLHTYRSVSMIICNCQTIVDRLFFFFPILIILTLCCRHDRKGDEKAVQHPRCQGDQAMEQVHEQHLWASQQTWQHHSRCRPLPRTGMGFASFIWNSLYMNTSAEFFSWSQPKKVFNRIDREPSKYSFQYRLLLFFSPVKPPLVSVTLHITIRLHFQIYAFCQSVLLGNGHIFLLSLNLYPVRL